VGQGYQVRRYQGGVIRAKPTEAPQQRLMAEGRFGSMLSKKGSQLLNIKGAWEINDSVPRLPALPW
jgi:hypothetical protein